MSNLPKKGPGRPAGSVNKATASAREAIAMFVDGNAHRLGEWLDRVADGVKIEKEDPETGETSVEYVVPPNSAKAFDMFQSVVEYHIPKLGRVEVAGDPEAPVKVEAQVTLFGELVKNLKLQRQTESD